MADAKISALTDGATPAATDAAPFARSGGTTVKLTWAEMKAAMPGAQIGYDQITTSSISVTSTTEATPTTIITCAAHTFDGAPVMVEFCAPAVQTPTVTVLGGGITVTPKLVFVLFESTTEIARLGLVAANMSLTGTTTGTLALLSSVSGDKFQFTPSAGSHTYIVGAYGNASGGVVYSGAAGTGADSPTWIRFTKV